MARIEASWDKFVYEDGTEVAGEIVHVEARIKDGGSDYVEVTMATIDAAAVTFDYELPPGKTLQVRGRAETDGVLSDLYSEVFELKFPLPRLTGFKARFVPL